MSDNTPVNRAQTRPVTVPLFHHATFMTMKLHEMVAWYGTVAGLLPVFYTEQGAWLTNDEANHRIAVVCHPALKPPVDKSTSTGHHHSAFEYRNFDQWLDNYIRLRNEGIVPFMTLDHGPTLSAYYVDPEGNGVEIQVDNFGAWDLSKEWMWSSVEFAANPLGVYVDPEKVVAAREAGLTFGEIHTRAHNGEYAPEEPPTDVLLPEVW